MALVLHWHSCMVLKVAQPDPACIKELVKKKKKKTILACSFGLVCATTFLSLMCELCVRVSALELEN